MPQPESISNTTSETSDLGEVDISKKPLNTNSFLDKDEALTRSDRVRFNNGKISGSINLSGGIIDDLVLLEYKETLDKDSSQISFLNPIASEGEYYLDTGWVTTDVGIELPTIETKWVSTGDLLDGSNSITLSWISDQGITFEKIISLDENYLFSVEQKN
jgi:YidC/Oxa1 family membrane protein insertase